MKLFEKQKVISAFPGTGKSYLAKKLQDFKLNVLDSDSSKFSWLSDGKTRDPNFPKNYIEHIKKNLSSADFIFVSSHKEVRDELKKEKIDYVLVYPDRSLKFEYVTRFIERGSPDKFVELMKENWDEFINQLEKESFPAKIVLKSGQYLQNIIKQIRNAR